MRKHCITAAAAAALVAAPALTTTPALAQTGNPLNSIFRCQAEGNKQTGGAAIGAIVGGVVGNQVADNERGLGTVLGAALGAAAGSYIGCRMQTSDQQRAEAAARQALEYGRNTTWTNPQTGASGRIDVVSTNPYSGGYNNGGYADDRGYRDQRYDQPVSLAGVRFAAGVQPQGSYLGASGRYQAANRVNVRSAPDGRVLTQLQAGETVDAMARVSSNNGDWILAGRNNVAIGYVSESVLRPLDQSYARNERREQRRADRRAQRQAAQQVCRTLDQTITTRGGQAQTQRYTACQTPSGEWVVQA